MWDTNKLFTEPEAQVKKIKNFNERFWHEDWLSVSIEGLGEPPPGYMEINTNGRLCARTIVLDEPDVNLAMDWGKVVLDDVFPGKVETWQLSHAFSRSFATEFAQSFQYIKQPVQRSLRWAVVELGRTLRGYSAAEVWRLPKSIQSLGPELMLILALHPEWAKTLNGKEFPFPLAPNLLVYPYRSRQEVFGVENRNSSLTFITTPSAFPGDAMHGAGYYY
ncbi:MAG TPA: hypothetical protein DEB09_01385 [Candidatus Magasanikbacteria bacterium]|nr:hypothetical protein [Candidatus Magasanikbacteria bacterium]